jgi:hypothetical protein
MGGDAFKYAGLVASPPTYGIAKWAGADSEKAGKIALGVAATAATAGLAGPALLGGGAGAAGLGAGGAGAGAGGAGAAGAGTAGAGAAGGLSTGQIAMMTAGKDMLGLLGPLLSKDSSRAPSAGGVGGGAPLQIPESLRYSLQRNARVPLGKSLLRG